MRQALAPIILAALLAAPGLATSATEGPPVAGQPYTGLKKTIAVESFQSGDNTGGATTGEGLAQMLSAAMMSDGRFVVVERQAMSAIQGEQALGQSGAATAETAAQHGQLIGASYLVRGVVTKYDPNHGGNNFSVGGLPLSLGVKDQQTYIEISIRVIDSTTGQVVFTSKADGIAKSHDVSLSSTASNGLGISNDKLTNTPLGVAAEAAIRKTVSRIDLGLDQQPWSALVVDFEGGKAIINAGAAQNMTPGTKLHVFRKGKVLTDPGTGEVLDVEMLPICTLAVESVREKVSVATLVDGDPPVRGDSVRN